jgi:hypothetical protein
MPLKVSEVEIAFTGHISTLPGVLRKLETSSRYFGIITKSDFERNVAPYPGPLTDTKVAQDYAKAAFNPVVNSHYGEGPVKALVTLEIYEYDAEAAKKLDTGVAPPPAPAKDKKPTPKPK